MTAGASDAIRATLQALDGVQTNSSPRQAADRFSDQVHRLEVDSLKVRARSQAMLARGDSYFEQWHHHLARIKDPEVRALAEQRRPELQESFARIKQLSHQTREDFQPFRSDLRKLRNILETDPGAASSSTTSDLVETIRRKGLEVGQDLAALLEELDKTAALVKPLRTAIRN